MVMEYIFSALTRLAILFVVSAALISHQAPSFLLLFGAFALVFTIAAATLAQRSRKYAKASSVAATA